MGYLFRRDIKFILLLGMFALLGVCFPVHAAEKAQKETIEVLLNVSEEGMAPYIKAFENKYPHITVNYKYIVDYENEMKKLLAEGEYGDVLFVPAFVMQTDYMKYFASLGKKQELEYKYNYLESSKSVGEEVYGLPYCAYIMGILYNKDVFYQAGVVNNPKSIPAFLEALQDIRDRTNAIPFYTNYADTWALTFWEYFTYIEMTGDPSYKEVEFVNEINPFRVGSTHYTVYELLYEIVTRGLSESNPTQTNWQQSKELLNKGYIGCIAIGSWAIEQFKGAGENSESIAFMPFPNEIAGRQYMTIAADYCYGISANSQHKEAAKAFVDFMMDESGYALDHEVLSIVKTDPYPDSYGNMENVILLTNSVANSKSYEMKLKLTQNLKLENGEGAKRVIEAASGIRNETLDDVMADWNTRWESSRTPDMVPEEEIPRDIADDIIMTQYKVMFSQTEMQYIEQNNLVGVGYLRNMAPFQYEDENGFAGMSKDICDIIMENTGLTLRYQAYDTKAGLLEALEKNEIQMIAGIDSEMFEESQLKFSRQYMTYMTVMVKNDALNLNDLSTAREACVKGWNLQKTADERTEYDTLAEAIKAVEQEKADYLVSNFFSVNYYIRQQKGKNISIVPLSSAGKVCFAFSSEVDTRLVSICNKCLYGIQDENVEFMLLAHMDPSDSRITFARFVEDNPFSCMVILCVIFAVILLQVTLVVREKDRSAKKHMIDAKRYEALAAMVDEYIFEYDSDTRMLHLDKKFHDKFGLDGDMELVDCGNGNQNELLENMVTQYRKALQRRENKTEAFQMTDLQGRTQWYCIFANTVAEKNEKPRHVIGKLVNVQKEVHEKQLMEDRTRHDMLTGLYNRDGFQKKFEELEQNSSKEKKSGFFVVTDITNLKQINDTLGHTGGDHVLLAFTAILSQELPQGSIIARYSGSEFILWMPKVEMEQASEIFEAITEQMNREFTYQSLSCRVSITLGAVYTEYPVPYSVIFKEADKVLYKTKQEGKSIHIISHLDEI